MKHNFTETELELIFNNPILNPILQKFYDKRIEFRDIIFEALLGYPIKDIAKENPLVIKHNSTGIFIYEKDKAVLFLNIENYKTEGRITSEGINMFYEHPIKGFSNKKNKESMIDCSYYKRFFSFFSLPTASCSCI